VFALSLSEEDKKILGAYGVNAYAELFAKPDNRPWYPAWGIARDEERQLFETQKGDLQREYLPKLVLSKPADYDSVWEEYTQKLQKLDVKGYEQWYTEKIKEAVAAAQ